MVAIIFLIKFSVNKTKNNSIYKIIRNWEMNCLFIIITFIP